MANDEAAVVGEFTPGPWYAKAATFLIMIVTKPNGCYADRVAECMYWSQPSRKQPDRATALANGRLIAAAPDLLETLVAARQALAAAVIAHAGGLMTEETVGEHIIIAKIDAAIAKATTSLDNAS